MRLIHLAAVFVMSALPAMATAADTPPALPEKSFDALGIPSPPPLASAEKYQTNTERAVVSGTTVADLRAFMDAHPTTDYVATTEAIPEIAGFTYLSGTWPAVGAVRRVDLADGSTVHERVLVNTPDNFAYQIWDISAGPGRFIDHIKGEFRWIETDGQVEVIWDYNIKPSLFIARPFINGFLRNDFGPFMAAGLGGQMEAFAAQ
ncbi:MAG: SRPBCC family protein [Pseudomonadota bacterium]